jgi:hypothetical protein
LPRDIAGNFQEDLMTRFPLHLIAAILLAIPALGADKHDNGEKHTKQRNVVIFVADGLRAGSINATDAPTMLGVRENGVFFRNSHSIFPTFTMPNGTAIASGHAQGDTGVTTNSIFVGFPIFISGNFGKTAGSLVPFIESDQVLADINSQFGGGFINEETLLQVARGNGYSTAAVGKIGPVGMQDVPELQPAAGGFAVTQTVIIDDATGTPAGVPLPPSITAALQAAGLPTIATPRVQPAGNNTTPGTLQANIGQQQFFADAMTKAILPTFKNSGKPFAVVFWSRDPDGTQHNQGDSLNQLSPGINGPTSRAAVKNADNNLKQILDFINSDPELKDNTDVVVTADHGFATISKHEIDATGKHFTSSFAATFTYKDITGRQEVNTGFLPAGFLAIDLAHFLKLPIFDADSPLPNGQGQLFYEPVDPTIPQQTKTQRQRPVAGNGILGGTGVVSRKTDAQVIVGANGGSDLIYVLDGGRPMVAKIVDFLSRQDYVGGIFVNDAFGEFPGTLPMSAVNLVGSSVVPRPSIVVSFKTFSLDPANPLQSAAQIADSTLQEGQGMHGTLARDNTFNNMSAFGPDFKSRFVDDAPASNADLPVTLAHILGFDLDGNGHLRGRVLREALRNGDESHDLDADRRVLVSPEASDKSTVLVFQQLGDHKYLDEACFVDASARDKAQPCR